MTDAAVTMPEVRPSAGLASALIKARKAARATVYKAGRNAEQKYKYVGHEQVILASRDVLLDHGLSLEQRSVAYAGEHVYHTQKGERLVWRWVGLFRLVHESGESAEYRYEATTMANDKAAYVASTALDRVAHLRVLELAGSDDEDPEHDSHDEREARDRPERPSGNGQRTDRTADPPSNVRRLERSPEPGALEQLYWPKLMRLTKADDLRAWWQTVEQENHTRPDKERLWRMFAHHVEKRLGGNAKAVAFGGL